MSRPYELKREAKELIRRRFTAILPIAGLLILLQTLLGILSARLSGYAEYASQVSFVATRLMEKLRDTADIAAQEALVAEALASMPQYMLPAPTAVVLTVVVYLASVLLSAGYQLHALMEARGMASDYRALFVGFSKPFKLLAVIFLTSLLTALGAIFFIIPGIIIAMRYGLAVYVLFENPELGPVECMRRSAELMRGSKRRLFVFELSFIPWLLLSSLVTTMATLPFLDLLLYPYYHIARARFYAELAGDIELAMEDESGPPEDE